MRFITGAYAAGRVVGGIGLNHSEDKAKPLRAAADEMTEFIARHRFGLAGIGLVGMPPRRLVDSLSDLLQYVLGMRARAAQLEEEARGQLL